MPQFVVCTNVECHLKVRGGLQIADPEADTSEKMYVSEFESE